MEANNEKPSQMPLINCQTAGVGAGATGSVGTPTNLGTWQIAKKKGFENYEEIQLYQKKVRSMNEVELKELLELCGDDWSLAFIFMSDRLSSSTPEQGITLEELQQLRREDLKDFNSRMRFDKYKKNQGEFVMREKCKEWLKKKQFPAKYLDQAMISFLRSQGKVKLVQKETVPKEFEKCAFPGDKYPDVHYAIDGTPIPSHKPSELKAHGMKLNSVEFDAFPLQTLRLYNLDVADPLIPRKTNGKPHEVRACHAVCRYWKAAYAGMIPAYEVGELLFTEFLITHYNAGFVNEDRQNIEFNRDFADARFTGPIPTWFPPQTAQAICEQYNLSLDNYDEYMAGRFNVTTVSDEIERCKEENRVEEITEEEAAEEYLQEVLKAAPEPVTVEEVYDCLIAPVTLEPYSVWMQPLPKTNEEVAEEIDCVPPAPIYCPGGFIGGNGPEYRDLTEQDFLRLAQEPMVEDEKPMREDEHIMEFCKQTNSVPPLKVMCSVIPPREMFPDMEIVRPEIADEVDEVEYKGKVGEFLIILEEPGDMGYTTSEKSAFSSEGSLRRDNYSLDVRSCLSEIAEMDEYTSTDYYDDPLDWEYTEEEDDFVIPWLKPDKGHFLPPCVQTVYFEEDQKYIITTPPPLPDEVLEALRVVKEHGVDVLVGNIPSVKKKVVKASVRADVKPHVSSKFKTYVVTKEEKKEEPPIVVKEEPPKEKPMAEWQTNFGQLLWERFGVEFPGALLKKVIGMMLENLSWHKAQYFTKFPHFCKKAMLVCVDALKKAGMLQKSIRLYEIGQENMKHGFPSSSKEEKSEFNLPKEIVYKKKKIEKFKKPEPPKRNFVMKYVHKRKLAARKDLPVIPEEREQPKVVRPAVQSSEIVCSCAPCRKFGQRAKTCVFKKNPFKRDLTQCGDVESNPGPEDDPAQESVETTQNIKFIDNREDMTVSTTAGRTEDVEQAIEESSWTKFQELLGRTFRLQSIVWDSNLSNKPVKILLPGAILTEVKFYYLNVLRSFLYYRPSFELKFMVNGTKFHCGKIVVYVVPPQWHDTEKDREVDTSRYYHKDLVTNFPHVFLDAARSNTAHIEVPFYHFLNYFVTQKDQIQSNDSLLMATVVVEEWNALKYAEGSSAQLEIEVFCKFTNCELHQPINAFGNEFAISRAEIQGGFWEWLSAIPGMMAEKFTGGLSTGLGFGLAKLIFDKPIDPRDAIPVVNRSIYPPCHAVGGDKSIRLALLPYSQTETTSAQVGGAVGDYDLRTLMSRPTRLMTTMWTTSMGKGAMQALFVTPSMVMPNHVEKMKNHTVYYPNMLAYLSRGFMFWRGTLKYKFQVVATSFHSGRLMVSFDPRLQAPTSVDDQSSMNSVIVDLQDDAHDFEITTTFMAVRPWLRCDHFRGDWTWKTEPLKMGIDCAGTIVLSVLVPLVCPNNVSQEVEINIYVSAGDDLEFAGVNALHPLTFNYPPDFRTLSEYSYYVVVPNCTLDTTHADPEGYLFNRDYYWSLYLAGYNLFKAKKIGYAGGTRDNWYDNLEPYNQAVEEMDYETINWLYQLSIMRSALGKKDADINFVKKWNAYNIDYPFPAVYTFSGVAQGETVGADLGEGSSTEEIVLTKGKTTASNVAPMTVSENAMNLQTILRRYYPVLNSFPIGNSFGYTLIRIPVTPAFAPEVVGPIRGWSRVNTIHQIAWYSKLYTYWRGSLRYMINFDDSVLDMYAWHRPTDYFKFGVESGVREITIQENMAFSGTLAISHLHASVQVEVPFLQPYSKLLIDHRQQWNDARCQNGTLFLAFRVKPRVQQHLPEPLNYSLFVSTGDDFVMSMLRAPPQVHEPNIEFGVGISFTEKCAGRYTSEFGDMVRDCRDDSRQTFLPSTMGFREPDIRKAWGWSQVDKYPSSAEGKEEPVKPKLLVSYNQRQKAIAQSGDVEENPGPGFFGEATGAMSAMSQMANGFDGCKESFEKTMAEAQKFLKEINDQNTIANVNIAVTKVQSMLDTMARHSEKLADMVNTTGDIGTRYAIMAAEIVCIGAALFNLRRCLEQPVLGNFLSLGISVAGCFGIACSASIQNMIKGLVNWVLQVPILAEERAQAQVSYESTADWFFTHEQGVVSSVAVFGTVLYAYIFGVIPPWDKIKSAIRDFFEKDSGAAKDKAEAQALDLKAAHFSVLGLTAMDKVYTKMMEYIQRFINWIFSRDDPAVALARQSQEVRDEVLKLIKDIDELDVNDTMLKALRDPLLHNRYFMLQDRVQNLLKMMLEEKWVGPLASIIQDCNKRVARLLKELQGLHVQPRKRYVPYCLYFYGPAGCGKSHSFDKWRDLAKEVMGLADYNLVYAKNIDDEFWSGYCQQPIVIWDEFAGNTDQDKKLGQFMQLNSDQPTTVVMADLKDKGMPFLSQMLIVGSNVDFPRPNNIRDLNALHRRRNKLIECRLAAGYTTERLERMSRDEGALYNHIQFRIKPRLRTGTRMGDNEGWMHINDLMPIIREDMEHWHAKQLETLKDLTPTAMPPGVIERVEVDGREIGEEEQQQLANEILQEFGADVEDEVQAEMQRAEAAAAAEAAALEAERQNPVEQQPVPEELQAEAQANEKKNFAAWLAAKKINLVGAKFGSTEMPIEVALQLKRNMLEQKPKIAVAWALTKMATAMTVRHIYDVVKSYFSKWKAALVKFWEENPKIVKAIGVLTTFGAIGAIIACHGNKAEHLEGDSPKEESAVMRDFRTIEGHYGVQGPSKKPTSKVIEGAHYDSGPAKKPVKKIVEGSYDHGPSKVAMSRVTQGTTDPVAESIARKVHKNVVIISWISVDHTVRMMRGFFVRGSLLLAPRHFFFKAERGQSFVIQKKEVNFVLEFDPVYLKESGTDDFCLYDCGPRVPQALDSMKYFISANDLGTVSKLPVGLMTVDKEYVHCMMFGQASGVVSYSYEDVKYGEVYKQSGWKTSMPTMSGDCGSVLVGYAKELKGAGKFLGIHVAGKSGKNEAFAVLVTREKLEALAKCFDEVVVGAEVQGLDEEEEAWSVARILPKGEFTKIGIMHNKMCLAQPMKTTFRKTPWFDDVAAVKLPPKIPAHLHPFINAEGERVSPLALALAKYGKPNVTPISRRHIIKMGGFLARTFQTKLDRTQKRIMTVNEAVLGIPGVEFADRLNMKSAAGWPWQVLEKEKPGKWHLFDDQGNIVYPALKEMLAKREKFAKEGKRVFSIWRDCLKDELRPVEKVQAGKTRLFTIAPVDFTILTRQYFLAFVCAFYNENCNDFFSAVGMNPESYEWTSLYNWLREYGVNCIAGDYQGFDGYMSPEIMNLCCVVINMWYNDGLENCKVRSTLFSEMIHTYQLVENVVYQTHKGNPSGNPLTVVINTIVCHCYLLLAWMVLCPEYVLDDFYKHVRAIHYGDDFLAVVKSTVSDRFNFVTIKQCLAQFGIVLTLDTKVEGNEPPFKHLDDCTFLKRGFRRDSDFGHNFILPTMSRDTIESFFYYYRYSADVEGQLQENMRAALNFAAFHGREYYEFLIDRWVEYMSRHDMAPIYVGFEEQIDVFLHTCGILATTLGPPLDLSKKKKKTEGMSTFMKISNSRLARAANAMLTAPLYMITAPLGVCSRSDKVERSDDRWAVAIPSGEGKSWLAEHYPHVFIDHDDFILDDFSLKSALKSGLPWYDKEKLREMDAPPGDRRILLVHHPDNTKRRILGSYVTPVPTFIRSNAAMRLALKNPTKMGRDARNEYLLKMARELEPDLFTDL